MNEDIMRNLVRQFTGDNKITHEFFGVDNTTDEYRNGQYYPRNRHDKNNNAYRNVEIDPAFVDKYLAAFTDKERENLLKTLENPNTREDTIKNFRAAIIAKHEEYLKDPYKVGGELGKAMMNAIGQDEQKRLDPAKTGANEVGQVLANNNVAFSGDSKQRTQLTNLTQKRVSVITPT